MGSKEGELFGEIGEVHHPTIKVVGVGGSGVNAVNRMIAAGLKGVEFLAIDTDPQSLEQSRARSKLKLRVKLRKGLCKDEGRHPETGRRAAGESRGEIARALERAEMVFVVAGMGGSAGTGAAPVVAEVAREAGALTVGVVTRPFTFETQRCRKVAEARINELQKRADTLLIIPCDGLLRIVDPEETSVPEAFGLIDDILRQAVQGITDLITLPSLLAHLERADIRPLLRAEAGTALVGAMGTGSASGAGCGVRAARTAISSPLLEEMSVGSARNVLINITGRPEALISEVREAVDFIAAATDPEAKVLFGGPVDENLQDEMHITVITTGTGR